MDGQQIIRLMQSLGQGKPSFRFGPEDSKKLLIEELRTRAAEKVNPFWRFLAAFMPVFQPVVQEMERENFRAMVKPLLASEFGPDGKVKVRQPIQPEPEKEGTAAARETTGPETAKASPAFQLPPPGVFQFGMGAAPGQEPPVSALPGGAGFSNAISAPTLPGEGFRSPAGKPESIVGSGGTIKGGEVQPGIGTSLVQTITEPGIAETEASPAQNDPSQAAGKGFSFDPWGPRAFSQPGPQQPGETTNKGGVPTSSPPNPGLPVTPPMTTSHHPPGQIAEKTSPWPEAIGGPTNDFVAPQIPLSIPRSGGGFSGLPEAAKAVSGPGMGAWLGQVQESPVNSGNISAMAGVSPQFSTTATQRQLFSGSATPPGAVPPEETGAATAELPKIQEIATPEGHSLPFPGPKYQESDENLPETGLQPDTSTPGYLASSPNLAQDKPRSAKQRTAGQVFRQPYPASPGFSTESAQISQVPRGTTPKIAPEQGAKSAIKPISQTAGPVAGSGDPAGSGPATKPVSGIVSTIPGTKTISGPAVATPGITPISSPLAPSQEPIAQAESAGGVFFPGEHGIQGTPGTPGIPDIHPSAPSATHPGIQSSVSKLPGSNYARSTPAAPPHTKFNPSQMDLAQLDLNKVRYREGKIVVPDEELQRLAGLQGQEPGGKAAQTIPGGQAPSYSPIPEGQAPTILASRPEYFQNPPQPGPGSAVNYPPRPEPAGLAPLFPHGAPGGGSFSPASGTTSPLTVRGHPPETGIGALGMMSGPGPGQNDELLREFREMKKIMQEIKRVLEQQKPETKVTGTRQFFGSRTVGEKSPRLPEKPQVNVSTLPGTLSTLMNARLLGQMRR